MAKKTLAEIQAERDAAAANGASNVDQTQAQPVAATAQGGSSQEVTDENVTQLGPDDKEPLNDDGSPNKPLVAEEALVAEAERDNADEELVDPSLVTDEDGLRVTKPKPRLPEGSTAPEPVGYVGPAHNGRGHRNVVSNTRGQLTLLDEETAEKFFEQPNFYTYVYDDGTKESVHVNMLKWADIEGRGYEAIGKSYRIGE